MAAKVKDQPLPFPMSKTGSASSGNKRGGNVQFKPKKAKRSVKRERK